MRIPRIFQDMTLAPDDCCTLSADASHHIVNVLRMKTGQRVILFNGRGGYHDGKILEIGKRSLVRVEIGQHFNVDNEPILKITLAQGISRGQRMDYTLQKAVELGVSGLVPIICEHGNINLSGDRQEKRLEHWRKVIVHACEQSGLNRIPSIQSPLNLDDWVKGRNNDFKIILHPVAGNSLLHSQRPEHNITLLAGPEGGFSDKEVHQALANGYHAIKLGPRILRTETAAIVAITACQVMWGDICSS
jgi:16S rRNA (uracil1498-N3)-methyltransferase